MNSPEPKLRWYQYRLRTLLIAISLFAICMSWVAVKMRQAERHRKAVELIVSNLFNTLDNTQSSCSFSSSDPKLSRTPLLPEQERNLRGRLKKLLLSENAKEIEPISPRISAKPELIIRYQIIKERGKEPDIYFFVYTGFNIKIIEVKYREETLAFTIKKEDFRQFISAIELLGGSSNL